MRYNRLTRDPKGHQRRWKRDGEVRPYRIPTPIYSDTWKDLERLEARNPLLSRQIICCVALETGISQLLTRGGKL